MKVLHLCTTFKGGGAGLAALRLHYALKANGVESSLIGSDVQNTSQYCSNIRISYLIIRLRCLIVKTLFFWDRSPSGIYKSYSLLPSRLPETVNRLGPDIVHIHWVQGEFLASTDIQRIKAPIVWTLHDMWPLLGSNHHLELSARDSTRDTVPSLIETLSTWVSQYIKHVKRNAFRSKSVTFIAPSQWIKRAFDNSGIQQYCQCHIIPNVVDASYEEISLNDNTYSPLEGVADSLILVGSMVSATDKIKGYDLLADALRILSTLRNDVTLVVVGKSSDEASATFSQYMPIKSLGFIRDPKEMQAIFKRVSVTCIPSRIENLPQMATESICCSTPVAAFRTGGLSSVVDHKKTGYLASPFDVSELATGLSWCLDHSLSIQQRCKIEFKNKMTEWSGTRVSQQHIQLYKNCIESHRRNTISPSAVQSYSSAEND